MSSSTALPTGTWQIDTAATTVTVTVKKMGFLTVPATLAVTSGEIVITDDQVTSVEITADAASYASKNPKRNEHVLGDDFLAAATHPSITLTSSDVSPSVGGYLCRGSVTIKGTSSPIEFAVSDVKVEGGAGSFTASTTVDRKAIGVDKMPTFVIGRNLEIDVAASVTKAGG